MEKELDFNIPNIGLNKKPMLNEDQSTQTIAPFFANVIASIQQGNPFVLMQWAKTVYNNELLKVNEADLNTLVAIATQCPLPAILRVQILNILQA